jgi:Outer membrane protein beta-barrel domain
MRGCLALVILSAAGSCCFAQSWSIGAAGGFGFYHDATISNAAGSASAGFGPRFAAGAVLGEDVGEHFGGELRYTFRDGDSELRFSGREANLDANAHALHFDFLAYATGKRARLRPFLAGGAGIKRYMGTGQVDPAQPLRSFATLAHADEVKGMVSFGGGVKALLGDHWLVRVDFRDYATPFPENVIVPTPGAKVHGWLHDFVPMLGVDWTFGR